MIDVYRGKVPVQRNPVSLALFIALFPQLVAGPIVRYVDVADEIDNRKENSADWASGFTRFCFGLAKKMLLANSMGSIADAVFSISAEALPAGTAWIGIIAYTLQIYLDFPRIPTWPSVWAECSGFTFLRILIIRIFRGV